VRNLLIIFIILFTLSCDASLVYKKNDAFGLYRKIYDPYLKFDSGTYFRWVNQIFWLYVDNTWVQIWNNKPPHLLLETQGSLLLGNGGLLLLE